MPSARPNIFQRLVRSWENLHPYNGAQVLHIQGPPPAAATLMQHWHQTLADLHVGQLSQSPANRIAYAISAPPTPTPTTPSPVTFLPPHTDLNAHLSAALNTPFSDVEPFLRPFLLPAVDSYYLGLSYRHWLADSVAIRLVLHELFHRVALGQPSRTQPLDLPHDTYRTLFGPPELAGPLNWSLLPALFDAARQSARMKRVRRVEGPDVDDHTLAFSHHTLRPNTIPRILAFARARNAKVNDVLLAALAVAVARHGPLATTTHRQDLALGTIVDLRPAAQPNLSNTFGLFLGFTTVFLHPHEYAPPDATLLSALATIAHQHSLARQNLTAPASMIRMAAGLTAHRLLKSPPKIKEFYRKRVPLAAGISNVNLSSDPLAAHHPHRLLDFIRVSPTGPMMPLVISASTLHNTFHFGLTHRLSVVPKIMAQTIATDLIQQLESL